ncbi:hypothetical protein [Streptomyces sp. NPDC058657]|uniref:hypothetical protein n=1 Tax=unclassified Streptomyces TaxID=2593676 RepID=UPI00366816D4
MTVGEVRELTDKEKDTLHAAEQHLLRDCIRARGFSYSVVPRRPVPEEREFRYVIDDIAWARLHGYGSDLQRRAERIRGEDPNQRYFKSLTAERRAAALAAVNGASPRGLSVRTPDGMLLTRSAEGCRAHAERTLYRDLGAWFRARSTLESLREMRTERVLADHDYARATRPWSRCMRAAGHPYTTPGAVRQALAAARPPLPRSREVALAVTEATCARSSGLAATAGRLDRTHDTELRRLHQSDVITGLRLQLAALPRARSLPH